MSKVLIGLVLALMVLGLLPFALIARSRASQSDNLPLHLVLDMDKQSKFKAQRSTPMFADGRAMRPEIAGTFAREDMAIKSEVLGDPHGPHLIHGLGGANADTLQLADPSAYAAVVEGRIRAPAMTDAQFDAVQPPNKDSDQAIAQDSTFYVRTIPPQFDVSMDFVKRGQERFNIYCAPCHGEAGFGDGPIAQRAKSLRTTPDAIGNWSDPQDLHAAKILGRPDGNIFNTITHGVRNMPAYDKQISVPDRWAIVAYVRALQRSQEPHPGDPGMPQ